MEGLRPDLSLPGAEVIGPSSPFPQALGLVEAFFGEEPEPVIATPSSKACGLLAGHHLCQLIGACGLLNVNGLHSSAVVLLRPLDDALDCFAAVTLVPGAAERWTSRDLKPSNAAKLWTAVAGDLFTSNGLSLPEYRRALREQFAHYMHCSYDLCLWDLFLEPLGEDPDTGRITGAYELNRQGKVINRNAHALDAHLTAHFLEFMTILRRAYVTEFDRRPELQAELDRLKKELVAIMERHAEHGCQNVLAPPEWQRGND